MRHGNANRKLNRTASHRKAMFDNMAEGRINLIGTKLAALSAGRPETQGESLWSVVGL